MFGFIPLYPFFPCLGFISAVSCEACVLIHSATPLSQEPPGADFFQAAYGSTCGDQACEWKPYCLRVTQRNCFHHLELCCWLWAAAPALATCLTPSLSFHPIHLNRHSSRHHLSPSVQIPKLTWHSPPTNLPAECFKFHGWYLLLTFGTFENLALKHILKLKLVFRFVGPKGFLPFQVFSDFYWKRD